MTNDFERNVHVAHEIASGRLGIDPSEIFRNVLDDLSGSESVSDHEIRNLYSDRLADAISEKLPSSFEDLDFEVYYDRAVKALRPVRIEIENESGRWVELGAAIDAPQMAARIARACPEEDSARLCREIEKVAATGEGFERETCDSLIEASAMKSELPSWKRKLANIVGKCFLAPALATYMFISATAGSAGAETFMNTVAIKTALNDKNAAIVQMLSEGVNDQVFSMKKFPHAKIGWAGFQKMLQGKTDLKKLDLVNQLWNMVAYKTDQELHGKPDHWAPPGVFSRKGGDCEDYAVAKYVTLRKLGFSTDQMRILVVSDSKTKQAHAVLAVWLDGKAHILDNMYGKIMTPENLKGRYLPVSSINENGRWGHAKVRTLVAEKDMKPASRTQKSPAAGPSM